VAYFEQGNQYDLVIMDLQMPVMDGYQTATYIRQQLKLQIPIIALTATALKGDQEKCRQVGMNDFMLKPFEFNDLYRRLLRLLYKDEFGEDNNNFIEERPMKNFMTSPCLKNLTIPNRLLDVVSLFLDNTPKEVKDLHRLAAEKRWDELYRLAHKVKGAVAILQAVPIAQLLGSIEEKAREQKDLTEIPEKVDEAVRLFMQMEQQLREMRTTLRQELGNYRLNQKTLFLSRVIFLNSFYEDPGCGR
jgi:CheY-like chemotaxis protein